MESVGHLTPDKALRWRSGASVTLLAGKLTIENQDQK